MDDAPNPPDAPPGGPPGVQLTLLGRFDVLVGQVRPALGDARPQVRQLMRVLALNAGRAMHREELAESMWPDQPSRDAIHRLQVAISQLRRVLGADDGSDAPLIQRDGECYRLCLPPGSRVDVLEFESALGRARRSRLAGDRGAEAGALQDALDCYLGDLLPEDGPADWVVERREQLRRAASLAASELAGLRAASDPRAGVEAAERAVSIDPYNDSAWRQLIALHEELGDVARAERARGSYAGVLDELGIEHGADALRPARRRS
jgi:DNA-binding SARP family transcriptional activator